MNTIFIDPIDREDLLEMVNTSLERHFSQGYSNSVSKMAKTLSAAILELYEVWKEEKKSSNVAHYVVDISCINRIIHGLKQVPPGLLGNVSKLYRLWVHEVCRVWGDQLMSEDDRVWFLKHLDRVCTSHLKQNLDQFLFASSIGNINYKVLPKIHVSKLQSSTSEVDEVILV